MKTYSALIATAVAHNTIKKDQLALRDEMQSLLKLVKTVEGQNDERVYDVISTRKEDLKALMKAHPERAGAISQEFKNLLAVVQRIEKNDFDGAMSELAVRKEELMGIHKHLLQMVNVELAAGTTPNATHQREWNVTYKVKDTSTGAAADAKVDKTDICLAEPTKVPTGEAAATGYKFKTTALPLVEVTKTVADDAVKAPVAWVHKLYKTRYTFKYKVKAGEGVAVAG
jgi:hypothetical protein